MKTASTLVILLLSARFALGVGIAAPQPEYRDSEILIQFRAGVSEREIATLERDFGLSKIKRFNGIGVYHYRLAADLTVPEAVDLLSQHDLVSFAEPNSIRRLCAYDSPNPNQWYLKNTGQTVNGTNGPPGNDINWTAAISKFTTTNPVIVAVVDSGIVLNHEDLAANVWVNPSEIFNGLDDDGNGYVDDLNGYDFFDHTPLPSDGTGHGTQVSGIIGAVANNGRGIVGICPRAKIMSLRVFSPLGQAAAADIISALEYALLKRARIINCSFGGESPSSAEQEEFEALRDAGILVVCAAGNGGTDGVGDNNDQVPIYPASYNLANMIAVAATDRTLALASFSNYGTNSVQVAAPGTDMYTTAFTNDTSYAFDNGTSFAAPVVSGVAALVLAQRPDLTYAQVKNLILSKNRPVAALAGKVASGGIVDASKVMTALANIPTNTSPPVITANPVSQAVAAGAAVRFGVAATGAAPLNYQWLFNGQPITDATDASYKIASVRLEQAGNYSVVVSNSYGSATSTAAALIVDGANAFGIIGVPFDYQIAANNNPTGFTASGLPPGLRCGTASGVIQGTPVAAGTFQVRVEAKSIFTTVSATIVIAIKQGAITSGTSVDGIVGVAFAYQIAANNNPTGFTASGLPPGLRCDTASGVIQGTPVAAGTFQVRVEAKSIFSTVSATVAITIGQGTITSAGGIDGIVGVPFTYQIAANNNPNRFSASSLPSGLHFDSTLGVIFGTPTGAGTFQVVVEAKNNYGSASATIVITIEEGSITSGTTVEGIVGVPFTYQIAANNNPTGFTASGLPPGSRCDTASGVIQGTPVASGTFQVRVEAKSIFSTVSATIVITIKQGSITSATSVPGIVGTGFSYQIAANNNPTGFTASGLPPDLRCDAASGVIQGTPVASGTFQVSVEAKSIFSTVSATIVITIKEPTIIGGGAQPALAISRTGDSFVVAWPVTSDGFILEETQLQQSTWSNSSAPVATNGNENVVFLPLQSTAKFFRLRKSSQ